MTVTHSLLSSTSAVPSAWFQGGVEATARPPILKAMTVGSRAEEDWFVAEAVRVNRRQPDRRGLSARSIEAFVLPAVRHRQFVLVADEANREPVGYLTWAYLSDEVASEKRQGCDRMLHPSEWNEGLNLWVMDFVAPQGRGHEVWKSARPLVVDKPRHVFWAGRRSGTASGSFCTRITPSLTNGRAACQ